MDKRTSMAIIILDNSEILMNEIDAVCKQIAMNNLVAFKRESLTVLKYKTVRD